jgi:sugar/nucleoside kinase (ribokinase family)
MPRQPSLLCIGNVTIDEAVQPDGTHSVAPGGDALFAALAARTHLDEVSWLAPIGADLPTALLDDLEAAGLAAALPGRRAEPTVRNLVSYHQDGSRDWQLVHGEEHFDLMSVHPADVQPAQLEHDGILVSAMSPAAQAELTGWLKQHSAATIFLDLQEDYLVGNEQAWLSVIAECDVFLPSEVEAIILSGGTDLERAIRMFSSLGPSVVVLKRAEKSCLIMDPGSQQVIEVAIEAVQPVDSTGAGDAFCGGFAADYLQSGDPVQAVRAGAAAARTAIAAPGLLGLLAQARERGSQVRSG